jgi:hypothetical protein
LRSRFLSLFLTALSLVGLVSFPAFTATACKAHTEETIVLARLEIPPSAYILFEHMATADVDRTSNWRFVIRKDGGFYNARNVQLFVTDAAARASDEPALFFNTPFPDAPQRILSEAQRAELDAAVDAARITSLKARYESSKASSNPSVERWTFVLGAEPKTVVVEDSAAPSSLKDLRKTIDRLVAAAARP